VIESCYDQYNFKKKSIVINTVLISIEPVWLVNEAYSAAMCVTI